MDDKGFDEVEVLRDLGVDLDEPIAEDNIEKSFPRERPKVTSPGRTKKEVALDSRITLRMEESLRQKAAERAAQSGLTLATYLRRLVLQDQGVLFYPVLPQERYRFFQDLAAVRAFVEDLRDRSGGEIKDSAVLMAVCDRISEDIRALQKLVLLANSGSGVPEEKSGGGEDSGRASEGAISLTNEEAEQLEHDLESSFYGGDSHDG